MTDAQDQQGRDKHLMESSTRRPATAEGCHLSEHTHTAQLRTLATWTDDDLSYDKPETGLKTPKSLFPPQRKRGSGNERLLKWARSAHLLLRVGTGAFSAHGEVAPEDLGSRSEIAAAGFCC